MKDIESSTVRVKGFEALKQLIVTGNVLLHFDPNSAGFRAFRMDKWVCKRSPDGTPEVIVLREMVTQASLPEEVRAQLKETDPLKNVELFTFVKRNDNEGVLDIHQEVEEGVLVPGSRGTDPLDTPSWLPIRMVAQDSEDYGRGYVEGLLGDLNTFDGLSLHITDGAAAMAKMLFTVRPNATLKPRGLLKPNLSVVVGTAEDVAVIQAQKGQDFQVALQLFIEIRERLEFSFLLNSAVQRPAERVTAEEIRRMSQEIEDALGGVHSVLAEEWQKPYVKFQLLRFERLGLLPEGLPDVINMQIATGLQGLGRGHELQYIGAFVGDVVPIRGIPEIGKVLNVDELIRKMAISHQIDVREPLRDPEEVAAEAKAAQQQESLSR